MVKIQDDDDLTMMGRILDVFRANNVPEAYWDGLISDIEETGGIFEAFRAADIPGPLSEWVIAAEYILTGGGLPGDWEAYGDWLYDSVKAGS